MSFMRNRLLRRFSILGRVGDLALVGGMALRLAQRSGWITDQLGEGEAGGSIGPAELVLAAAAAVRLMRRRTRR